MGKFIVAFDQGTTSSRAIIFNKEGNIVSLSQKEFGQIFPQPGWVEHDPNEIWSTQLGVATEAVMKAGITVGEIAAIGITNQRETTIVWDKTTGQPVYNAIVWQDKRTATFCDELRKQGYKEKIQQKTGLIIDSYFSATKVKWILDHVSGARKKAQEGKLLFGTVDSWLIWKLTGGKVHATDETNASRTMLFDIHQLKWDDELLELMTIPKSMLPEVKSCSEIYGYTQNILTAVKIPISGIAGDQQAALFGQLCTEAGMVKNTYGTGCFMLMNTGEKPVISKNNLLSTIAWSLNGKTSYALEGSVFIAGAVVQWLRDGLKFIRESSETGQLAKKASDNEGVYMVPAFSGLGAPYWNQHARGLIVGITRGTTDAHFARAALESIAFQTMDVLTAMEKDAAINISELRVDGGATVNEFLMQFQSDILMKKVVRPKITETTALGAAYFAGLAVGFWNDIADIQNQWQAEKVFSPAIDMDKKNRLIEGWNRAIRTAAFWADHP